MITTIATVLFALAATAHGHGNLVDPFPDFIDPNSDTRNSAVLPGDQYNTSPEDNTKAFTKNIQASSYKTLKDFVVANPDKCGTCGLTKENGAKKTLNADGNVYWGHGTEGFTPSHEGPCELWCDDTQVFQNDNCARNVKNGTMPIDTSKCNGASRLTIYWLALHSPSWQIYINCVSLAGGAAPSPSSSKPSSAPTMKPTSSPITPTPSEDPYTPYPSESPYTPTPSEDPYTPYPSDSPSTPYPSESPYTPTPSEDPYTPYPSESPYTPTPSDDPYTPYPSDSPNTPSPATPSPPSNRQVQGYYQCGGKNYNGPTQCASDFHCNKWNEWYSQCVPSESADVGVPTWGQCGGSGFNGSTNCQSTDV
ncbi:hypothetical protein AC1031_005543 [Aphanomyces cochlioides]|nr:hypothetical protein AC1031_005543 [Aphanomyces cochlioides]